MSELPAIDAIIDQGVALMRQAISETRERGVLDETEIEQCLEALAARFPWGHLIGMAYHLGMLTLIRANCDMAETCDEA